MERKLKKTLHKAANQYKFTDNVNIQSVINKKGRKPFNGGFKLNYVVAPLIAVTILGLGAWNIPSVNAAISETIEKAINLIVSDNYSELEDNLNQMPPTLAHMAIEINPEGRKRTSYLSGEKEYSKYENGDYTVSDGKSVGQFDKEKNTFTIWKYDRPSQSFEEEYFKTVDESKIQSLGTDAFLGRTVDKYLINGSSELWFDQETKLILREFSVSGNQRVEDSKVIDIKFNVEVDESFFEVKAPKGAKVIESTDPY
ncbi:hypothetical protein D1953_20445 [Peribacillus asahii]|uniref:Outer membrane lipoprotein carrier protein LolA n=1 Tax=Peribacillus asahii TaxID=228899 RepID=A0A398B0P7_9BACI|nr:hypothetical protein [Peribacillus asahii]RID81560.1 hypothetical protein D1953_20445 [Peribacillus asahii]